jgi:hypothetical protein
VVGIPRDKRTVDDGTCKSGTKSVAYVLVSGEQALGTAGYRRHGYPRYDQIGQAVPGVGDLDGGGTDEAVDGGPYDGTVDTKAGAVYLTSTAPTGHGLTTSDGAEWLGETGNDRPDNAVAGAGRVFVILAPTAGTFVPERPRQLARGRWQRRRGHQPRRNRHRRERGLDSERGRALGPLLAQ